MNSIWTYKHYEETINKYQDSGYSIGSFENYLKNPESKFVILRHDIDFDPTLLTPLLEVESTCGVSSTSFFRVVSKNYNFAAPSTYDLQEKIASYGSESGLHLDIGMEALWKNNQFEAANIQFQLYNSVAFKKMKGFSLHQPTNNGGYEFATELVNNWEVEYHAYEPRFFKTMKYLSDSGGRWREGHWSEKINQFDQFQVLTHPIWHHDGVAQRSF